MLVLTASEMARMDRRTIEEIGIPGIVLMENAAQGAAAFFLEAVSDLLARHIVVVAGSGNNAGDGFALARIFHSRGASVSVVCLRSPERLRGDALTNFQIVENMGVPVHRWDEGVDFDVQWPWVREGGAVIDAMLGTGLKSEVQGIYRRVIEELNTLSVPVLAVDLSSGLDATSGRPLGAAVRAYATATFGFLKIGHLVEPGPEYTGLLKVVDIGIPPALAASEGIRRRLLDEETVSAWLEPRSSFAHKGSAGHAAVLAGSLGKTGAATLICEGAARVGAGLVTLFIPASLNSILEVKLTEAMTYPIEETTDRSPAHGALSEILHFLEGKQAFAMGPGISLHAETKALVKDLVGRVRCPMVLDADALTVMSEEPDMFRAASAPLVLTPHPGEMARLVRGSVRQVQDNRLEIASDFSRKFGVVLLLKGHRTVIAAPDGRIAINGSGNPAMATGGMGDTLTGMIAGFLAQGIRPFEAACLGTYIHGAAADRRMTGVATRGLIASDILEEIPRVVGRLESLEGRPWSS